jgi:hypothetical protein
MSTFDDKRAAAWSDSNGSVQIDSAEYGVAIAGVTTDQVGATIAVLGVNPLGLGVVQYNEAGDLEQFGVNIAGFEGVVFDPPPVLLAAPATVPGVTGLVAIGGLGDVNEIFFYDVGNGEPTRAGGVSGTECGLTEGNLGTRMAFRERGDGELDLIALDGNELVFFRSVFNPAAPENGCSRCTVPSNGLGAQDVAVAELRASSPGEEIVLTFDGLFTVFEGDAIVSQDITDCLEGPLFFDARGSGNGETDFGARIAVGDGDGDDSLDLAFSAPSTERVYVFHEFDTSNSPVVPQIVTGAADAISFGKGPMAFMDLDLTEGDELVVGDPQGNPEGVIGAGQVSIFQYSDDGGGEFEPRAVIYDSSPETGQNYGRALSEVEFGFGGDDADVLAVGAVNETFTLFQSLDNGTDPRQL